MSINQSCRLTIGILKDILNYYENIIVSSTNLDILVTLHFWVKTKYNCKISKRKG